MKSAVKRSLNSSLLGATFLEEYNSLKKFRSSLRISFGSLILGPFWLIKDDICLRR